MTALPLAADVNELALSIFAVVVAITLVITYWASKRTRSATMSWAAGRGITGAQNGFAIASDYMSAASFLGIAGLIFLYGFDGFLYSVSFLVAFLTVLFLLAERMCNAGRFNTAGAVTGVVFGVVSSILLIVVSPKVWPGPDSEGSPIGWTLANPGIVSIPLGFIGCWLGTVLTREHGAERTFAEQHVRSETGIGAERAVAGI